MRHRNGRWYSRETGAFTATRKNASPVSRQKTTETVLAHPDGTITVTPVAGKPMLA
jgi:hypothetical protein